MFTDVLCSQMTADLFQHNVHYNLGMELLYELYFFAYRVGRSISNELIKFSSNLD
ncbi:hypothetical protein V1478_001987 [Vespula squamosa]|uniref:Maturase K n=1 Tax=Vespula squamosa TaxID=30214 RepID=A0ABD2BYP7_VESSQ